MGVDAFPDTVPVDLDLALARWENEGGLPGNVTRGPAGRPRVRVGRVYDPRTAQDGARVLVDRLWPRGLTKARADLDEWCKQIAPSTELRTWYGHDPERFDEFARRYRSELGEPGRAESLRHLRDLARRQALTLLTATRDADISEATVLAALLAADAPGSGTDPPGLHPVTSAEEDPA